MVFHYIFKCGWPVLEPHKTDSSIPPTTNDERPVKVMFLADTHLLGFRRGHWFDKLRRYDSNLICLTHISYV